MLAHELRNPLAPILDAFQVMKLAARDTQTVASLREMMERPVRDMTRLVEDLLDVLADQQRQDQLRKTLVELVTLTRQVVEASRPFIEDAAATLLTLVDPGRPNPPGSRPEAVEQDHQQLARDRAKYTDPAAASG